MSGYDARCFVGPVSSERMAYRLRHEFVLVEPRRCAYVDVANSLATQVGQSLVLQHGLKKMVEPEPFVAGVQGN